MALVRLQGRYGYIDHAGHCVVEPQFEDGRCFQDGMAAVMKDGKWGYMDRSGKLRFYGWDCTAYFGHGLGPVQRDGKWGYINKQGELVIGLHRIQPPRPQRGP